jgi:hypothetical protein
MRRRPPRRYLVRGPDGRELLCPSLRDLHALYTQGFLTDEDLVKQEGAAKWIPAGRMPALHGVRDVRRDPRKMALLLAATLAIGLAVALLLKR